MSENEKKAGPWKAVAFLIIIILGLIIKANLTGN
ncbi:MAG: hypothetical protein ACI9N9_002281 [Enterobacterales bacterium]|jgi:hypothetical protein